MKDQVATFAGGCFWCTEAIFKRIKGVKTVIPGYAGGKIKNPSYEKVKSGITGHAEAIQITFDPSVISYEKLLDVFWATHDPTSLNKQDYDIGTQYRSVIFYHTSEQKEVVLASKERLEKEKKFTGQIVTEIVPYEAFYKAEDYHMDYYDKNRSYPYCTVIIDPKIKKLMKNFVTEIKEEYK